MIAVDCARSGVDEARDAGSVRRYQHVEKTRDVVLVHADRVCDRARHAAEGRLMQNDIHRPARPAALIERADVALDEITILPLACADRFLHVVPVPGRQVV